MGVNLSEINQNINRLIQNMSEQNRRAYQIFYDPNPQDVSLPQLDENGNLVTVTIPNRAKIKKQMWDDVNAAIGLWNRTFYVDQQNGDDNNDGSQNAPFKSFQKAIDSIPVGGKGTIVLLSEYNAGEDTYTISNKTVVLSGEGHTINKELTINSVGNGNKYRVETLLYLDNALLIFGGSLNIIVSDPNGYSQYDLPSWGHGLFCTSAYSFVQIKKDEKASLNIDSTSVSVALFGVSWGSVIDIIFSRNSGCSDNAKNLRAFLDLGRKSVANLWFQDFHNDNKNYLLDSNGNNIDITSSVFSLVKDPNGIPRNIVSNLIF